MYFFSTGVKAWHLRRPRGGEPRAHHREVRALERGFGQRHQTGSKLRRGHWAPGSGKVERHRPVLVRNIKADEPDPSSAALVQSSDSADKLSREFVIGRAHLSTKLIPSGERPTTVMGASVIGRGRLCSWDSCLHSDWLLVIWSPRKLLYQIDPARAPIRSITSDDRA